MAGTDRQRELITGGPAIILVEPERLFQQPARQVVLKCERELPMLLNSHETDRLLLRSFMLEDVDAVHAYQSREDVARYMPWQPRSRDEVAGLIAKWADPAGDPDAVKWAVTVKDSGQLIGNVSLFICDRDARQGEVGYCFHPDFGGKGYASEAVRVLMDIGFGPMNLHRIFGRCSAANRSSWRLMERLGMRREAHFLEHCIFKGEFDEEFQYAILSREWAAMTQGSH